MFVCVICGMEYETPELASICASQGVKQHKVKIGQEFVIPFREGLRYQVVELLVASKLTHEPGVKAKLMSENNLATYFGIDIPDIQIFDEETVVKYLIGADN